MAKGCSPATDRFEAYKAKIRAYSGTGGPATTPLHHPAEARPDVPQGAAGVRRLVPVPERSIRSLRFRRHRRGSPDPAGKRRPVLPPPRLQRGGVRIGTERPQSGQPALSPERP